MLSLTSFKSDFSVAIIWKSKLVFLIITCQFLCYLATLSAELTSWRLWWLANINSTPLLWKKHLSWGNDFLEYLKMAGWNTGQQSGVHRAFEVTFWRSRNVVKEFNKHSFLMGNSLINNDLSRSDCLSFSTTEVHFWAWPLRVALRPRGWACSEGTAAGWAQDCLLLLPEGFQQQHWRWGFNLTQNY